jgi:DNA-binding Lrp family transcriptional regulator
MQSLDDLDVRIFREFNGPGSPQWNVRESFSTIARRLGVDEETVRLRVLRLRERGAISSWRIAVNPRLLGCEEMGLDMEVGNESNKPEALALLRSLPGITQVADFRGSGMLGIFWHNRPNPLPWLRKKLDPISGWRLRASWTSPFPEPSVKMRAIDWRIIVSMRDDARMDLRTVASEMQTTTRTVQRRLSALTEGKAIFIVATPKFHRIAGIVCNFLVYCSDVGRKRAADATVRQVLPRVGILDADPEQHSMIGVSCENLARAEESLAQLRALYGVDTIRFAMVREIFTVDDWVDGLLRERVRSVPRRAKQACVR